MQRYHRLLLRNIFCILLFVVSLTAQKQSYAQGIRSITPTATAIAVVEPPDSNVYALAYPYIERRDSVVYTHGDLLAASTASAYGGELPSPLVLQGTTTPVYCAGRRLRRAELTIRLDLGTEYRYGSNVFAVDLSFLTYGNAVSLPRGYPPFPIHIDQDKPEQIWRFTFDANSSPNITTYQGLTTLSTFIGAGYQASASVAKDVRFIVSVYEEYEIDAHRIGGSAAPLVEPIKIVDGTKNPVRFAWDIASSCNDTFPGYQLQVLKLYNTDANKKDDKEVRATVDWNQALTIEVENKKTMIDITLTEGTGYYVWRVRPIGNYYEGDIADSRNWGEWSTAPSDGDVLEYTDPAAPLVTSNNALLYYEQFDDNKSWVHSRSFTEGGLIHESMQYFNSLSQPVQQQALVKSEGDKLVSQTLYDYSGRAALSSMTVPVQSKSFGYVSGMLQNSGSEYTAENFDTDSKFHTPDAIDGGLVASYYSSINPDTQIPDAQGYPFARMLYETDGSGRVREVSGVGATHRLQRSTTTKDRTTKVAYSSVSDEELIRLFGDEAPVASSVIKRLTTDPNKVTSVEYLSKDGGVIATCFEKTQGDVLLLDLPNDEAVLAMTVADKIEGRVQSGDNLYRAQKRYSFTDTTNIVVNYSLTPLQASMNGECIEYCATCEYVVWIIAHNVHEPANSQEYPIVVSPSGCATSSPVSQSYSLRLPPGTYIIERKIDANPIDGNNKTAAQRFKDAIASQVRGTLAAHPTIAALYTYLDQGDIEGFYEYLGVTNLDSVLTTTGIEVPTTCCALQLPLIAPVCARNPCRDSVPDFEQYLIDSWGEEYGGGTPDNLNKYFWHYGGNAKYPTTAAYPNGKGALNKMVQYMLAEVANAQPLYDCKELWDCWRDIVDAYQTLAYKENTTERNTNFDLLEAFLDCAGRRYVNQTTIPYDDGGGVGYLTHAYKLIYNSGNTEAWTHCSTVVGDPIAWENQPDSSGQWKRFYDCVRTYKAQPNNNDSDLDKFKGCLGKADDGEERVDCARTMRDEMEAACRSYCDAQRGVYIQQILKAFEEKGIPAQWNAVSCLATALVDRCKENCELSVTTKEVGGEVELDSLGLVHEWQKVRQVYSQIFEVHFPNTSNQCPDTSYEFKQGWSVDYKGIILEHLNQRLFEFKQTIGASGAVWNFKSALEEVAPAAMVNSFTSFEVPVDPSMAMGFEVDENCKLWYKRQSECGSPSSPHPLVSHLNNYLNTFWGYAIPGTQIPYSDVLTIYPTGYPGEPQIIAQNRDFAIGSLPQSYTSSLAAIANTEFSCINGNTAPQPASAYIHSFGPVDQMSINAWRLDDYSPTFIAHAAQIPFFRTFHVNVYIDDWNIVESAWLRGIWEPSILLADKNLFYQRACSGVEQHINKHFELRPQQAFDRRVYQFFKRSDYTSAIRYTDKIGRFGQDTDGYLTYTSYVAYDATGDSLKFDPANATTTQLCSIRFFGRDSVMLSNNICSTFVCPDMCMRWIPRPAIPEDTTSVLTPIPCKPLVLQRIRSALHDQIERCVAAKVEEAEEVYRGACQDMSMLNETVEVHYPINYYHFTLYYYDRAGNLLKTVPPKGVRLTALTRMDAPDHKMVNAYQYNSLGQLVYSKDNDRGESRVAHDDKLRVRLTQNSQQAGTGTVSYVKYDHLGRTIEVGDTTWTTRGGANFYTSLLLADGVFPTAGVERTYFVYNTPSGTTYTDENNIQHQQEFLRNALSYAYTDDGVKTHYSYDAHGNTYWVAQELPGMPREHWVEYEYDLISGLVQRQIYNAGFPDRLYHKFSYDDDLRLRRVYTSRDGQIWDNDVRYSYYAHGPLRRREIGEDSLQGVDYTYTLQGWLKAINHPDSPTDAVGGTTPDPGKDGPRGINTHIPKDAFGQELFYYAGDFTRAPFHSAQTTFLGGTSLYNGMIAAQSSRVQTVPFAPIFGQDLKGEQYRYDIMGRLRNNNTYKWVGLWQFDLAGASTYQYDPNGNLKSLGRAAYRASGASSLMDNQQFFYSTIAGAESNQLTHISDTAPAGNFAEDIDGQQPNTYTYNSIGQLVRDASMGAATGVNNIAWNTYGKIHAVTQVLPSGWTRTDTTIYDAGGNKVKQRVVIAPPSGVSGTVTDYSTYYVYGAQGALLAVYKQDCSGSSGGIIGGGTAVTGYSNEVVTGYEAQALEGGGGCTAPVVCTDLILYGLGREGVIHPGAVIMPPVADDGLFARALDYKEYELTDHLGNVRVTIGDRKLSTLDANDEPIDFAVDVLTTGQYFPYGMGKPNQMYVKPQHERYRFGYNGMERELGDELFGNTYSTMFRPLETRMGRWWSPDPIVHPWESPYASMGNNPISFTDPLGLQKQGTGFLPGVPTPNAADPGWHAPLQYESAGWDVMKDLVFSNNTATSNLPEVNNDSGFYGFSWNIDPDRDWLWGSGKGLYSANPLDPLAPRPVYQTPFWGGSPFTRSEIEAELESKGHSFRTENDLTDYFEDFASDYIGFNIYDRGTAPSFVSSWGKIFRPDIFGDLAVSYYEQGIFINPFKSEFYPHSLMGEVKFVTEGKVIGTQYKQIGAILEYLSLSLGALSKWGASMWIITPGDVSLHSGLIAKAKAQNIRLYHAQLFRFKSTGLVYFHVIQWSGKVMPKYLAPTLIQLYGIPGIPITGMVPTSWPPPAN